MKWIILAVLVAVVYSTTDDVENEVAAEDHAHTKCHYKCGTGLFHAAGKCRSDGRCECVYGFTGPNSKYLGGSYPTNTIVADHCTQPCHYTHDYRNNHCTYQDKYYGSGYEHPHHYPTDVYHAPAGHSQKHVYGYYDEYNCHWKCGWGVYHAAGKCAGRNQCLCWWGWTGANAVYIKSGDYKGRIVASYCTKACHYTHDYTNPHCGHIAKDYYPHEHHGHHGHH